MKAIKIAVVAVVVTCIFASMSAFGKHRHVNSIYDQYKDKENMVSLSFSSTILRGMLRGRDNKEVRHLLKNVRSVKILAYDQSDKGHIKEMADQINHSFDADNYKEMMTVNDGGDHVSFKISMNDKVIDGFAIVAADSESLAVILIDGEMTMDDAREIAKNINTKNISM